MDLFSCIRGIINSGLITEATNHRYKQDSTVIATAVATAAQKIAHAQNTAAHGLHTTQLFNFVIAPSPLCIRANSSGAP